MNSVQAQCWRQIDLLNAQVNTTQSNSTTLAPGKIAAIVESNSTTVSFLNTCSGPVENARYQTDPYEPNTTMVIAVSELFDTNSAANNFSLIAVTCDGSTTLRMTEPGVYTINTPDFAVTALRVPRSNDSQSCADYANTTFSISSLTAYCKDHATFERCADLAPAKPSSSHRKRTTVALAATYTLLAIATASSFF